MFGWNKNLPSHEPRETRTEMFVQNSIKVLAKPVLVPSRQEALA